MAARKQNFKHKGSETDRNSPKSVQTFTYTMILCFCATSVSRNRESHKNIKDLKNNLRFDYFLCYTAIFIPLLLIIYSCKIRVCNPHVSISLWTRRNISIKLLLLLRVRYSIFSPQCVSVMQKLQKHMPRSWRGSSESARKRLGVVTSTRQGRGE